MQSPKRITSFSAHDRQLFLDSFDVVFCDCDGVIWHTFRDAIPGSAEAINYLRKLGKQVTFVTNNSLSETQKQLEKFQRCQLNVEKQDLIHPAQTICDYLKSIQFDGLIYCIASLPFKNVLRAAGFQLAAEKNRIISESVHELRDAIYNTDPVKAVIIDVDFNLTAAKLMRAHVHLKDPQCLLIGGAADALIPFGDGDIIGSGPFINIVESSAKRKAIILGKPGLDLCKMLKQRYNLIDPKRALFIGDSLSSDIKFGKMCGFQTLLVLTGATDENALLNVVDDECMPDFIATSLGDLY